MIFKKGLLKESQHIREPKSKSNQLARSNPKITADAALRRLTTGSLAKQKGKIK